MTLSAALALAKTFGPWIVLGLFAAAFALLVVDRNALAARDQKRVACTAAVAGARGARPVDQVCDAPIAAAAVDAAQARACDAQLPGLTSGAPVVCSAPVQHLAADRDARAADVANRDQQLDQARKDQASAVARASARATTQAVRDAHAQAVVQAAPRDDRGDLVFDADRLRDLAGSDPADAAPGGAGGRDPG